MIVEIDSVTAAVKWLRNHITVGETNVIFEVADDVDIMAVPTTLRRCRRCRWLFITDRIGGIGTKECPKCGHRTTIVSEADIVVQGNQSFRTNSRGRRVRRAVSRINIVTLSRTLCTFIREKLR